MRLYTAQEAAEALRVSRQTIWKYGREGKLETVHYGRTVRYVMPDVAGNSEGGRNEEKESYNA